jgi:glutamine amidotransferase-like uncharacterized protein
MQMKEVAARVLTLSLVLLLVGMTASPMSFTNANVTRSDMTNIRVGVYYGAESVSDSSRTALVRMFEWMNATVEILHPSDVKSGELAGYHMVVIPGGNAGNYISDLGTTGLEKIRSFVREGGSYFGVCAGAYLACDTLIWEGVGIQYQLDIFNGTGVGAIDEIAPWPNYGMCSIEVNRSSTVIDLSDEPNEHRVMYYGGPFFVLDNPEDAQTLATYSVNDEPAMIALGFHEGRAFLSGPHAEWEEDSERDGIDQFDIYDDEGSEWPMMLSVSLWLVENVAETTEVPDQSPAMLALVIAGGAVVAAAVLVLSRMRRSRAM